jgi:2-desacetyl-2-hydroxyethyl bacteriochlorophyllide A dehydrogenase
MADFFTIDARRLHRVPDELDDRTAALIEPLSTPVHAVRIAGDVRDKAVVILGTGTIGLLLLGVVVAHGARQVVVTDVLEAKREKALALGADVAIDALAPDVGAQVREALGESADVVFDCVAISSTVQLGIALADKGGTLVIVGVPVGEVSVPLPLIQDHQIRIQGSATYLPEDYEESIDLLRRGAVKAADIVTSVRPLEEVADAFAASAGGAEIKALVAIDSKVLTTS